MTRDTSMSAFRKALDTAPNTRARIMMLLGRHKPGLICEEIEVFLHAPHQSISARLCELAKAGRIVDSGKRRMTSYENKSIVWRVAE